MESEHVQRNGRRFNAQRTALSNRLGIPLRQREGEMVPAEQREGIRTDLVSSFVQDRNETEMS